jgi:hypothetical protein
MGLGDKNSTLWSESPYAFCTYPLAISLQADRVIFLEKIFHKIQADHVYWPDIQEHRWNARYRDGSLCLREYFQNNTWKHEATMTLSNGDLLSRGLKGGQWIVSLYHDPDQHPGVAWHAKVEDLFVEDWSSDVFTSLNILTGYAFSQEQSRSLLEGGLVVEKMTGHGLYENHTVILQAMDMNAGPICVRAKGHYDPFVDRLDVDLIVRPKISRALSSVATILSPWSLGLAWVGVQSIGKDVDTWNEEMYHLRGSLNDWDIIPWEPEILSFDLSVDE